jgi:WD40 repeat protein
MSEHKKTITAISWNPRNSDLFASASSDNVVIIWNVAQQKIVSSLTSMKSAACSLGWCLHEKECVSFVSGCGPLALWNYNQENGITIHKEAQNFTSDICQFRWHHKKVGRLAFGHVDGSVSLFCPGELLWYIKHILKSLYIFLGLFICLSLFGMLGLYINKTVI